MVILAVLIWRAQCLLSLCKCNVLCLLSLLLAFSFRNGQQTTGIRNSKESTKTLTTPLWRRMHTLRGAGRTRLRNAFSATGKWTKKPNSQCYGTVVIVPCATVPMYLFSEQMLSAPIRLLVCNSVFWFLESVSRSSSCWETEVCMC